MKLKKFEKYAGGTSADDDDEFTYEESHKNSLKKETELYNEDLNIPGKSFRIKRVKDGWDIFVDKKVSGGIKDSKLTGKEKAYLQTLDGIKFFMNYIKSGWNSVNDFRKKIRELI